MEITVLFTTENKPDFVSRLIMRHDDVDYSHTLMRYIDRDGTMQIFQATAEFGVHKIASSEYFETHKIIHGKTVKLTVDAEYFYGFVEGSLGKKYAYRQVAGMIFGKESDNNDEKMICSEIVGIVLTEMAGLKIKGDQDIWRPIHCFKAVGAEKYAG